MTKRLLQLAAVLILAGLVMGAGPKKPTCVAPGCKDPEIAEGTYTCGYMHKGKIVPVHFKCALRASMRVPTFSKK